MNNQIRNLFGEPNKINGDTYNLPNHQKEFVRNDGYFQNHHYQTLPLKELVEQNEPDNRLDSWKDFQYDPEKDNKRNEPIWGTRQENGTIRLQDGRHRAKALLNAGYKNINIPIYTDPSYVKTDKLVQDATKKFGLAKNPRTATYMLPNGELLDGSYGTNNSREDHRYIQEIYDDNNLVLDNLSDYMTDFMRRGNIRMKPEMLGAELSAKPSDAQLNALVKLFNQAKLNNIEANGNNPGYLENIRNENELYNFIKKHFTN